MMSNLKERQSTASLLPGSAMKRSIERIRHPTPSICSKEFEGIATQANEQGSGSRLVLDVFSENSQSPLKNTSIKQCDRVFKDSIKNQFKHRLMIQKNQEQKPQNDSDKLKLINQMLENLDDQYKKNQIKNFENDYQEYLDNRSSNKQEIIVIDKKEKLMKPNQIEKKLKNQFFGNLINKRKIDQYHINLKPILFQIVEWGKEQKLHLFKDRLHPSTLKCISKCQDNISQGNTAQNSYQIVISDKTEEQQVLEPQENNQTFVSSHICEIDVEYHSTDDKNKFLIVKTIEEIEDHLSFRYILETIRIFKEEKSETSDPVISEHDEKDGSYPNSNLLTMNQQFSKQKSTFPTEFDFGQYHNNDTNQFDQISQPNLVKYQQIKQIIVSDTGPICQTDDYIQPENMIPTSVIYLGKYLFFFSKQHMENACKFVLNEINLLEQTQAENENFEIPSDVHDENVRIHFAQEGEQKGRQLVFKPDELDMTEEFIDSFLLDQYIQVVDNFELDEIQIYSMKDLKNCLTQNLRLNGMNQPVFFNNKFIQFFVIRDCQNGPSDIEKLLSKETND